MSRARRVASIAVVSLLAGAAAAPAQSAGDTARLELSSQRPATSAGFSVTAAFAPERVVDQITIALPSGSKLSFAGAPKCDKTDQELLDTGGPSKNCPASTRLGTGTATAILGEDAPARFTVAIYNASKGLVLDILLNGTTAFQAYPVVKGTKLVFPLPTAKEINARVTRFSVRFGKAGTKAKPFFRTPARCPSSGELKGSVQARSNGRTTVTKTSAKCARAKA